MAIPLPDLDDRGYAELLDEARTLIPAFSPEWTNHNPSDPGITLVELFAWLADMLVWRTNQVPDAAVHGFLRLLNGPDCAGGGSLDAEVRATVLELRDANRAVTPADYERLATTVFNRWREEAQAREEAGAPLLEWYRIARLAPGPDIPPSQVSPIGRARCVPRRDVGAGTEGERVRDMPGHVSLLVLPARGAGGSAAPRVDEPASRHGDGPDGPSSVRRRNPARAARARGSGAPSAAARRAPSPPRRAAKSPRRNLFV